MRAVETPVHTGCSGGKRHPTCGDIHNCEQGYRDLVHSPADPATNPEVPLPALWQLLSAVEAPWQHSLQLTTLPVHQAPSHLRRHAQLEASRAITAGHHSLVSRRSTDTQL